MTNPATRHAVSILATLALCLLTGCGEGYVLRGRVIESTVSYVEIVDPADPRLSQPDPAKLNRETITRDISGPDGQVALRVDRFGAGFLEYDVGLFARKPGYTPAQHYFRLPADSKRVLIMMAPGRDRDLGETPENYLEDYERFR